MKNFQNLGKTLSKKEQKAITGGYSSEECTHEFGVCIGGCAEEQSWLSILTRPKMSLIEMGYCYGGCRAKKKICEINETVSGIS